MTRTNDIINEIKALRGANVSIFGQPTTLDSEVDDFTVDIIDILKSLEDYEVDSWEVYEEIEAKDGDFEETWSDAFEGVEDGEDAFFILQDLGEFWGDWKGDNSYNWSGNVSNHFDLKFAKASDGGEWMALKVHRYGDVRGNYTDSILYHFDSDCTFYEKISECDKYTVVNVDGVDYDVTVSALSDTFEVFLDGDYVCDAYGWDADDVADVIREKRA